MSVNKIIFTITLFLFSVAVFAQKEQNLISGKYSLQELKSILIPQAQWAPFPHLDEWTGRTIGDKKLMEEYIAIAETYMDYDWPAVAANLSLLYNRTGNRIQYDDLNRKRRRILATFLLAEISENKGRFVDHIINGTWAICEESWWGSVAHSGGLTDVTKPNVELFSAETAALLSWVDYFMGDKFDAISPHLRKRIRHEVNFRMLEPCLNSEFNWMKGKNNWNPWICSNWINCALLLEKDNDRRADMIAKALKSLDIYLNNFHQDGGCDEGPNYWGHGVGALYDCIALLNLATNDSFRYIFDNERFRKMGQFIYRTQIGENYIINFADARPKINISASMVYRFGKDIKDQDMMDFGAYYRGMRYLAGIYMIQLSHYFFELFIWDEYQNATQRLPLPKDAWYSDLQIMIARDQEGSTSGFSLAAKGGTNGESHNHNDVGSFMVFYDGQPLLIDPGKGSYTKRYFGKDRYNLWMMRSDFHNTPTINGVVQGAGGKYRASDVSYKAEKSAVAFSLDIAGAYLPEAGVNSWKRTLTLTRGKGVQVKDASDLKKAESAVQHLMTCYPAEITIPGEITIHYKNNDGKNIDFVVKYNHKQMSAKVEKVKLETEEDLGIGGIFESWGDTVYRINLEATAPKMKDVYLFEIKKKD